MSAFIVETISGFLGAARDDVRALLEAADERLTSVRGDLDRRLGAVLGGDGSNADRADSVVVIGQGLNDEVLKRLSIKLVASVAGIAWGLGITNAALGAGGVGVMIGIGIAVEPLIALVLGLVVLFVCGKCCFGVIRELGRRMENAASELRAFEQ